MGRERSVSVEPQAGTRASQPGALGHIPFDKGGFVGVTALVLILLAGLLASPAGAGKRHPGEKYTGPLAQVTPDYWVDPQTGQVSECGEQTYTFGVPDWCSPATHPYYNPEVKFRVVSKKNKKGKLRPVTVTEFTFGPQYRSCPEDPSNMYDNYVEGVVDFTVDIPVKGRSFAGSETYQGVNNDGSVFAVWNVEASGQIPREGPATGTARVDVWRPSDGWCSSGVMTWSAEKEAGGPPSGSAPA
jgi:hypothetical protein